MGEAIEIKREKLGVVCEGVFPKPTASLVLLGTGASLHREQARESFRWLLS